MNVNTSYLTGNHVLCTYLYTLIHVVWLDSSHRTSKVVLLCTAVTDDNDVLEHLGVVLKSNDNVWSCLHVGWLITYVSDIESCSLRSLNLEVTVKI